MHGLSKLLKSKTVIKKILWAFVILCLIAVTSYIFILNIGDYFKYDVINQVETISKNTTIFPAVIFCSTKLHYNLIDLVKTCTYRRKACNFTNNDFDLFIESDDRNCLRFNGYHEKLAKESGSLKKTNGIGYLNGLDVTFALPKDYDGIRVFILDNYVNTIEQEIDFFFR